MVRKSKVNDETAYFCEECGFGYADRDTAMKCEEWCSTHKSCSIEITRRALYKPTSFRRIDL
ncbi:MAG: hypothetical protein ACE5OY_06800 [Candidatus Bathyarchaeia archaeon]